MGRRMASARTSRNLRWQKQNALAAAGGNLSRAGQMAPIVPQLRRSALDIARNHLPGAIPRPVRTGKGKAQAKRVASFFLHVSFRRPCQRKLDRSAGGQFSRNDSRPLQGACYEKGRAKMVCCETKTRLLNQK